MLLAMVMNPECPAEGEISQSYLLYLAQAVLLAAWLEQVDDRNG